MVERPRDPRATVAAGYDALGERFAAWASKVRDPARDRLFAELVASLPDHARVLDVGCGSGLPWTAKLALRFDVTGIDISARQIAAARRNVPGATFIVGDISTADLGAGAFDAAVALFSIGHVPARDHEAVLARLRRSLRPGGLLLASLPASADRGWSGPWIDGVEMYFAGLGEERYREILDETGWRLIEASVAVADEPDGPARFLWILAHAPTEGPGSAEPAGGPRRARARR